MNANFILDARCHEWKLASSSASKKYSKMYILLLVPSYSSHLFPYSRSIGKYGKIKSFERYMVIWDNSRSAGKME